MGAIAGSERVEQPGAAIHLSGSVRVRVSWRPGAPGSIYCRSFLASAAWLTGCFAHSHWRAAAAVPPTAGASPSSLDVAPRRTALRRKTAAAPSWPELLNGRTDACTSATEKSGCYTLLCSQVRLLALCSAAHLIHWQHFLVRPGLAWPGLRLVSSRLVSRRAC